MPKPLTDKQEKFCKEVVANGGELPSSAVDVHFGSKYYVYLLVDPTSNAIFYVGKGKERRAHHHYRDFKAARVQNVGKHRRIAHIHEAGLKPKIIVFANELEEGNAFDIERYLIDRFLPWITNLTKGQQSRAEKVKAWAESRLRIFVSFKSFCLARYRTEQEIELYWESKQLLEKVASGEFHLHNKFVTTTRDGKVISFESSYS